MTTEHELPDAELDVMTCLWRVPAATAREIREMLHLRRPMAHASVCTLLNRLEAKGLVVRQRAPVGKAFLYRAATEPQRAHRRLVRKLLDGVFGGNGVALVASLLESRPPNETELAELERLLKDLRENQSRKARKPRRSEP
jgi:BlaI family transcriptional regulator, penicillinase repressor